MTETEHETKTDCKTKESMADQNGFVRFSKEKLNDVLEDLDEAQKRVDSVMNSLKFQVLNNTDGIEDVISCAPEEAFRDSGRPSIEHMVKKPIRRQIGNLKPVSIMLANLIQRLGLHNLEE